MKVFTAERHYDYEGFALIGIFSTREAAQAAIEADQKKRKYGDGWEVNEFELDSIVE